MSQSVEIERRLVAVLAADVAGFGRLTEADETGTLRLLASQRAILDAKISRHRGRIANTAGDSVLAEFPSAVNAVQCAVEAQQALRDAAEVEPESMRLLFRIGIHVGDVMVRGGDLLGNGINVAARLEALAEPGGIIISSAAHEQVRRIIPLTYYDLGLQTIKNIEDPVRAFSINDPRTTATSTEISSDLSKPLSLPEKPSIAVLPFQNMSGDPEQEYFADGMVEDITTALSRIRWLFVIARNSSFTFKGKAIDVKQVGRNLGVRYVLEGSVRKSGNRIRLTGQLVDAETGVNLWADRFDGTIDDVFELQDKITESVVAAIATRLQKSEVARSKRKLPRDLNAYDYYLRGLSKTHEFKRASLEEARVFLTKAIELDPDFALAYGASAFWYFAWITLGWSEKRDQEVEEAIALARKALELDDEDALTLAYAGWILAYETRELEDGAALIERATVADPNNAAAWNALGWINLFLGNHSDAIQYYKRSERLSPLDPLGFFAHTGLAYALLFSGRHVEAVKWAEKSVRRNPNYLPAYRAVIAAQALSGQIEAASAANKLASRIAPNGRVSTIRARLLFRRTDDIELLCEGLRLGGMPE